MKKWAQLKKWGSTNLKYLDNVLLLSFIITAGVAFYAMLTQSIASLLFFRLSSINEIIMSVLMLRLFGFQHIPFGGSWLKKPVVLEEDTADA